MRGRTALRRVRVSVEPAGSFGQDRTGTIGNFTDLRFNSATLAKAQAVVADEAMVQRLHHRRPGHHGFKSATIDVAGDLVPLGTAYAPGSTPTQDTLSKVLESMLATTAQRGDGGTVQASPSPTTTNFSLDTGEGAEFAEGQLIAVETAAGSNVYALSFIESKSTDAITLGIALPAAPASGCKVLNCERVGLGDAAVNAQTSLQFLVEGENRGDIFLALGAQGPLAIEWPLGGLVRWSSQYQVASWLHDDEMATPQGGSPIAAATLTGGTPVVCAAGGVVLSAEGGTVRTLPTVAEIAMTLGASWQPVDSLNGGDTGGKAQWAFVRGEQPTVTMLVLASAEEYLDAFAARTQYRILTQAGNRAAGMVATLWRDMELIAVPTEEDRGGLQWTRLSFGYVGDGALSPVEIARF